MIESEVITNKKVPGMNGEEHTAAFKIWHYSFEVIIAKIHLESAEFLRESGVVLSGDKEIDRTMAQEKVHARLTPWALAEHVSEGVNFVVVNSEDCAKIYTMIQQHIGDWLYAAETNPNITDAPLADLRKLDELAGYLYPYARLYLQSRPFHGRFMDNVESIRGRRGGIGRTAPSKAQANASVNAPTTGQEKHNPLSEALALRLNERKKPWLNGGS